MFTVEQIKQAHGKVKSGADFPRYIQDLIGLGVTGYETYVTDGHTIYHGIDGFIAQSDARYPAMVIAGISDKGKFQKDLKEHQQGKTDFMSFCKSCAVLGVEKWIVDMDKMTCAYYNQAGDEMLMEEIPTP